MTPIPPSRMFTIKKALDAYKAKAGQDAPVYDASQGDGGASLPGVPSYLLESALELQIKQGTGYDQPFGTPLFRKAAAENYWKLDAASGWNTSNIIFVQGGRDGLNKAYNAMVTLGHGRVGDVLLVSRVPWISYNWGPYGLGLNVLQAPGDPADGWRYTPEGIRAAVEFAARDGRKIAGIVITSPDNPTGRTIPLDEQIMLGKVALEAGVAFVLYDWIYHWVSDGGPSDINTVLQAFTSEERERLMFLDGLTKSLGASNIRSAQLLAGKAVVDHIVSQASHGVVPSFFGQAVAIAAYQQGFGEAARSIIEPCAQSRQVMKRVLKDSGLPHVLGDGYYAFIDVTRYIEAAGYASSEQLGGYVAEEYGVAVVPGVYFSDAGANWVRFSYALPPEKTEKALQQFMAGLQSLLK
jgi:aspartate/methionine/tyrosine aminotransferase